MTIRTPRIIAILTLLGVCAADNRVSAQPIAPARPPSNAFGNFFFPGSQVMPNAGTTVNNIPRLGMGGGAMGPGGLGAGPGGLGYNPFNSNYYGPWTPYFLASQPVVFNNRGHWYSNYYGHWYQNGLTNGSGVLSNGGNGGGGFRIGANPLIGSGAFGVPNSGLMGVPGGGIQGGLGMPGAMPNKQ